MRPEDDLLIFDVDASARADRAFYLAAKEKAYLRYVTARHDVPEVCNGIYAVKRDVRDAVGNYYLVKPHSLLGPHIAAEYRDLTNFRWGFEDATDDYYVVKPDSLFDPHMVSREGLTAARELLFSQKEASPLSSFNLNAVGKDLIGARELLFSQKEALYQAFFKLEAAGKVYSKFDTPIPGGSSAKVLSKHLTDAGLRIRENFDMIDKIEIPLAKAEHDCAAINNLGYYKDKCSSLAAAVYRRKEVEDSHKEADIKLKLAKDAVASCVMDSAGNKSKLVAYANECSTEVGWFAMLVNVRKGFVEKLEAFIKELPAPGRTEIVKNVLDRDLDVNKNDEFPFTGEVSPFSVELALFGTKTPEFSVELMSVFGMQMPVVDAQTSTFWQESLWVFFCKAPLTFIAYSFVWVLAGVLVSGAAFFYAKELVHCYWSGPPAPVGCNYQIVDASFDCLGALTWSDVAAYDFLFFLLAADTWLALLCKSVAFGILLPFIFVYCDIRAKTAVVKRRRKFGK